MKRTIIIFTCLLLLLAGSVWAGPKISKNSGGQPYDADLAALAGLTSAANTIPYFTGSHTAGLITSSANMIELLTSANYAAARTYLGLGTMALETATNYVTKALYDEYSILYADTDNTPAAKTVSANTVVGRENTGGIVAISGAANRIAGWNASGELDAYSTIQMDDSGAQFKSATASKGTTKIDQTGLSDTIVYTVKPLADANATFSPGKTFTDGKWCSYATATGFTCAQDAPAGSGDVTGVGDCTGGACLDGSSDGGTTISLYDGDSHKATIDVPDISGDITITLPNATATLVGEGVATGGVILGDSGPDAAGELGYASAQLVFHDGTSARNVAKAGTLTNTKWCTTDGTVISCTEDAPAGSGDITAVGSCTTGSCEAIGNAATGGGYLRFAEDTDNGTDYIQLKGADDAGTNPSLTLSGSPANTEDLTIALGANDNKVTVSSSTGVTELNISAINLVTTGTISGATPSSTDENGKTLSAAEQYGYFHWATGAGTWNLVGAAAGMNFCVYSTTAAAVVINPDDGDTIVLNGVALSAGDSITSASGAGDFICLIAKDANTWYTLGRSGTWTDTN